jgi:iron complex outermembrane recepter protein
MLLKMYGLKNRPGRSYAGFVKFTFTIFILSLSCFPAQAQYTFTGKVIDSSNGAGLPAVNLQVNDSSVYTTDLRGNFKFDSQNPAVTVKASYVGYEPVMAAIVSPKPVTIEMKASQFMLGEVVVTAYESKQKIKEVPGSIALITKKDLSVDNDVNVVPALNRVPGILMQDGTYNTNRLTIRGIGARSLFGTSKIRAYYDNIPLTTGDGETTIEDIDPSLIDRIEIIKGPSSSLYGAGLGGTVLMSSFQPSPGQKSLQYKVTGGSYGYLKNSITGEAGFNKTKFAAGINHIHSNGYRDNNLFNRTTAGLSSKTELGKKTNLALLVNYINLFGQIPSSLDQTTYDNDPASAATSWKATQGFEDYDKALTGADLTQGIGKSSELDASVFWTYRNSYERRPFNILTELNRAWGSRIKISNTGKLLGNEINSVIGYEYFEDRYNWKTIENSNNSEGALLSDNKEGRRNMNVFAKSDYMLPTHTLITAGLNVNITDYHYQDLYSTDSIDNSGSYTFGHTWSPRVGISQALNKHVNIYASISHGFSPPSLSETLTPAGSINPEIKPETGIDYEIGTRGFLMHSRWYIDLSLYSLQVRNLLVARRTGPDEFIGVNAGETSHKGIEFNTNFHILGEGDGTGSDLIGYFTYNLSDFIFSDFVDDTTDYSGNDLTGVPRSAINAGFNFSTRPGFYADVAYRFVDKIPANDANSVFTDPYHLFNIKAGFRKNIFNRMTLDVFGIINNVFGEKYASMVQVNASPAPNGPRYFYPGLPRNYYAGLELGYEF